MQELEGTKLFDQGEVLPNDLERFLRTVFARAVLLRPVIPGTIQHQPISSPKIAREAGAGRVSGEGIHLEKVARWSKLWHEVIDEGVTVGCSAQVGRSDEEPFAGLRE